MVEFLLKTRGILLGVAANKKNGQNVLSLKPQLQNYEPFDTINGSAQPRIQNVD